MQATRNHFIWALSKKLKAELAGIRDENREDAVRSWALSIAASLGVC
jgi:hypothetical protein